MTLSVEKRLFIVTRTLLTFTVAVVAHGIVCLTARAQSQTQLQLAAEIVRQNYCSVGEDVSLQLTVRLRYSNVGSQRLIVYNGHDLFYQTKVRSEPAPLTKPYEVLLLNMRYFDEEIERIEAHSPGRVFVKLAPGASFERELITGIGVTDKERSSTSVKPGPHTVQLVVSTWYQSTKLAEKLREHWRRQGLLWTQPVSSPPVKVVIERPVTASRCQ